MPPAPAMIGGARDGARRRRVCRTRHTATIWPMTRRVQPHDRCVTESLAMLYWGQGHHQQAIDVFDALIRRSPGNPDLVVRRDAVRAEFDATRPTPFDAAAEWRAQRAGLAGGCRAESPHPRRDRSRVSTRSIRRPSSPPRRSRATLRRFRPGSGSSIDDADRGGERSEPEPARHARAGAVRLCHAR